MTNVGALVIVAVYLVGMLLVGFVVGKLKIKDSEDYMVAGRRMGIFMVPSPCPPTTSEEGPRPDSRRRPSRTGA